MISELFDHAEFESLRYQHFSKQIISGRLNEYLLEQSQNKRTSLDDRSLSVDSALSREVVGEIIAHDESLRTKALIHDIKSNPENILLDKPRSATVKRLLRSSLLGFLAVFELSQSKQREINRVMNRYRTTDDFGDTDYSKVVGKLVSLVEKSECVDDDEVEDAVRFLFLLALCDASSIANEASTSSSDRKDGRKYELDCLEILERHGYEARLTPINDQGADIIASKGSFSFAIQCKDIGRAVGNKAVQEVASARQFYGNDFAVVVSPEGFTKSALELAAKTDVILVRSDSLPIILDLSKNYG